MFVPVLVVKWPISQQSNTYTVLKSCKQYKVPLGNWALNNTCCPVVLIVTRAVTHGYAA